MIKSIIIMAITVFIIISTFDDLLSNSNSNDHKFF